MNSNSSSPTSQKNTSECLMKRTYQDNEGNNDTTITTTRVLAPRPIKLRRRHKSIASLLLSPSTDNTNNATTNTILIPSPSILNSSPNEDKNKPTTTFPNDSTIEDLLQVMKVSSLSRSKSNASVSTSTSSRTNSRCTTPLQQTETTNSSSPRLNTPTSKLPDAYYSFPKSPVSRISRNPIVLNSSFYS